MDARALASIVMLGVALICATVLIAMRTLPASEFITVLGIVIASLSPSPLAKKGPEN